MHILAIETTGPFGSVALIKNISGKVTVESLYTKERLSHLKEIAPMIKELLDKEGLKPEELDYVAVSVGPGSFTGIRIGVTTARALCQSLDLPALKVGSIDLWAHEGENNCLTVAVYNARRGQVYGGIFSYPKEGKIFGNTLLKPGPYMLDEVLVEVNKFLENEPEKYKKAIFYGDGIDAYQDKIEEEALRERYFFAPEKDRYQRAELLAPIALKAAEENKFQSYKELEPDYMRLAEAEQRLKDGTLNLKKGM